MLGNPVPELVSKMDSNLLIHCEYTGNFLHSSSTLFPTEVILSSLATSSRTSHIQSARVEHSCTPKPLRVTAAEPIRRRFGTLGECGFQREELISLGDGKYSSGNFSPHHAIVSVPYSPLEMYLAGWIPPDDVPDIWVAEDGSWLMRERSGRRPQHQKDADGDWIFYC